MSKLVFFTNEIAKGNFGFSARAAVKSNDEMGALALAFDHMTGGLQERDKIKTLFGKFHGSSVTQNLLTSGEIALGGSKKKATIFFSDIRGFTSYSEKRSPEKVVENLNAYFSVMVDIILRNHGIVDKFIGDAIMAVWGAPQSTGHDSYYGLKAALEMREALVALNDKFIAAGEEPLKIGMGLHEGEVISGTIGSKDRMEYTVMGDAANTASRVESVTKAFGTDLLVTENLMASVGERFLFEEAGEVEAKGKSKPLKLYLVHGYRAENGEEVVIRTPYSQYDAEKSDKAKVKS
jgi:adenylate cyclase